jgi:hypothetical protein
MFKRNIIPFSYCVFFPLLIGIILLVIPEISPSNNGIPNPIERLVRVCVTLWLMFSFITPAIPFIPNIESSSIALFNTWGRYYQLRDNNNEPRIDRSIFPIPYFASTLIINSFASLVFYFAISTFTKMPFSINIVVTTTNFLVLFFVHILLYNKIVSAVYSDD